MRPGEVGYVLGELDAALPSGRRADDKQRQAFAQELAVLDFQTAVGTARHLKGRVEWFPSWAEFRRAYDSETARQRALRAAEHAGETCPECEGDQWIVLGRAPMVVRPCSRCLPVAHTRWAEGHLMSGHSCPECVDLRGDPADAKAARAAIRGRHRLVPLSEVRRVRPPEDEAVSSAGELRARLSSLLRRASDLGDGS